METATPTTSTQVTVEPAGHPVQWAWVHRPDPPLHSSLMWVSTEEWRERGSHALYIVRLLAHLLCNISLSVLCTALTKSCDRNLLHSGHHPFEWIRAVMSCHVMSCPSLPHFSYLEISHCLFSLIQCLIITPHSYPKAQSRVSTCYQSFLLYFILSYSILFYFIECLMSNV